MTDDLSLQEQRRLSPGHHEIRARNARYAAYVIEHISPQRQRELAIEADYPLGTAIALRQAFLREAAIALELILKAIIAQRIRMGGGSYKEMKRVPAHHKIHDLWYLGGMPKPERQGSYTLLVLQEVVIWSGRYAAPLKDEDQAAANKRINAVARSKMLGSTKVYMYEEVGWDEFERLFEECSATYWKLIEEYPLT